MAVYSMTGYATAHSGGSAAPVSGESSREPQAGVGVEIRSVNSRFLDLVFKLPDDLRAAEPTLRELLGARLKRGKVEVRAWVEGRTDTVPRQPGPADLQKLAGLQDTVRAWLPTAPALSVADVLQLMARQQGHPGELTESLVATAQTTLDGLLSAREREGKRRGVARPSRSTELVRLSWLLTSLRSLRRRRRRTTTAAADDSGGRRRGRLHLPPLAP